MATTKIRLNKAHRGLAVGFMILLICTGCGSALRLPFDLLSTQGATGVQDAQGAQGAQAAQAAQGTSQVFKPAPPLASTPTPIENATEIVKPQATPICLDNLTFVSDATIPDGSEVEAKSTLDKRWEVKNSGNCGWNEQYRLRLIAGPAMNAPQEQALFPGRSGSQVFLEVTFEAPAESGHYRSAWQAYNPAGQPFGDPIFIDIAVK